MYWKEPKYSINAVKLMLAGAIEDTWYFDSPDFAERYLSMYNNWPEPDQIEKAQEQYIENFLA